MNWRPRVFYGIAAGLAIVTGWCFFLLHGTGSSHLLLPIIVLLGCVATLHQLSGSRVAMGTVVGCFVASLFCRILAASPQHDAVLRSPLLSLANIAATLALGLALVWALEREHASADSSHQLRHELDTVLANISDGAFLFDRGGRLIRVNAAALKLSGRRMEDLLGKSVEALASTVEVENSKRPSLVRQALAGNQVEPVERNLFDTVNNRRIYLAAIATPLRTSRDEVTGALLLLRDISEMKLLETRMIESERQIATGQMAASITHDFANILEVIEKAASILDMMEDRPAEDRRRYVEMVRMATHRGAETIRRLREYLAGGGGEMRQVDLNELARDAIELTRPLWKSRGNIDVQGEFAPIPPVRGNPVDLRRVLTNLILNAIQAMGDEGGTVLLRTESEAPLVRCSVEDTGPGIPQEHQKKIFLPYYTTKPEGTGLGLSGAQKIILAHGGNLTFYSEVGRGTRFNIELPIATEGGHDAQRAHHAAEKTSSTYSRG